MRPVLAWRAGGCGDFGNFGNTVAVWKPEKAEPAKRAAYSARIGRSEQCGGTPVLSLRQHCDSTSLTLCHPHEILAIGALNRAFAPGRAGTGFPNGSLTTEYL